MQGSDHRMCPPSEPRMVFYRSVGEIRYLHLLLVFVTAMLYLLDTATLFTDRKQSLSEFKVYIVYTKGAFFDRNLSIYVED